MYKLEAPIYFYFFAVLLLVLFVFVGNVLWKKKKQRHFAEAGLLSKIAPTTSTFKAILKVVIFSLGLSFLILSLVNPKMGTQLKTVKREGVDIVFALDVSKSMLAEDIAPNRLEKSKQIISKVIENLGSDRIGVIVYAGSAYPLLPITTDHASAKMFLQNANPDMVSSQGTAINEALDLAKTYYNNDDQTNKFLIILSDGEDHEAQTVSLAETLTESGVKVFTVGVGTESGQPIPLRKNGRMTYKKDRKGEVVITQRHAEVLKEIAEKTQGRYIDGNRTEKPVNAIVDVIANAQKHEFETKQFSDYKDQFQWFVALGMFFLLLDVFLH
ncbi:MAG: VWA domain-containing protein, partial [Flavicella sp.]|nr:VWA domain-containing protein [Flavicella sp.]